MKRDYERYRLNGITPPVGTILGPDRDGQSAVVVETDDTGCWVKHADESHKEAMTRRVLVTKEVNSPTEAREFLRWWASVATHVLSRDGRR